MTQTDTPRNENANVSSHTPQSPRNRGSRWRWLIMLGLLIGCWWTVTAMAEPAVEWRGDFALAQMEAKKRNVPILLDFWATYCPPCRMLDIRVFASKDVAATVTATCVPFKVDMTTAGPTSEAMTLANKYGVQATPTVLLIDGNSMELIAKANGEDLGSVAAFNKFLARHSNQVNR